MTCKNCFKCLETKKLSEFYRHSAMADGHLNKCKACTKSDVSTHRAENISKIRAYDRARGQLESRKEKVREYERTKRGKERMRSGSAAWIKRNPEKRQAHTLLRREIMSKRMKSLPCEKCGAKAHAHHDDYSKPLDVRWLCPKHHSEHHKRERVYE